jgi:hypothetical protein
LLLECLLWLSERFQWFPINVHKGWTVLIGIAAIGAVSVVMILWFAASLVFRLRFQFSVWSLLVAVVAVAVPFSWLAVEMKRARHQEAVANRLNNTRNAIAAHGGLYGVCYDYQPPWNIQPQTPSWLRRFLGNDFFSDVLTADFLNDEDFETDYLETFPHLRWFRRQERKLSDEDLDHIGTLTQLRYLDLSDCSVTSDGLKRLAKVLPQLNVFNIAQSTEAGTKLRVFTSIGIDDQGLKLLARSSHLRELNLNGTDITDVGLEHIKNLTQLQVLYLGCTKVTDSGLRYIGGMPMLKNLFLDCTEITGTGFMYLASFGNLETLDLSISSVTDTGAEQIGRIKPLKSLELYNTRITDVGLLHLEPLTNLQRLTLWNTRVTSQGVKKLQHALPNCNIYYDGNRK